MWDVGFRDQDLGGRGQGKGFKDCVCLAAQHDTGPFPSVVNIPDIMPCHLRGIFAFEGGSKP